MRPRRWHLVALAVVAAAVGGVVAMAVSTAGTPPDSGPGFAVFPPAASVCPAAAWLEGVPFVTDGRDHGLGATATPVGAATLGCAPDDDPKAEARQVEGVDPRLAVRIAAPPGEALWWNAWLCAERTDAALRRCLTSRLVVDGRAYVEIGLARMNRPPLPDGGPRGTGAWRDDPKATVNVSAVAGVDESLALRRTNDGTVLYLAEPVCLDRGNAFGAPSGDLPQDVLDCLRETAPASG